MIEGKARATCWCLGAMVGLAGLVLGSAAGTSGAADQKPAPGPSGKPFTDITDQAHVRHRHIKPVLDKKLDNIMPWMASVGAAAAAADYNNDGWIDLYVTNSNEGTPNSLYRNNRDGTFTDVAVQAGVADANAAHGGSMDAVWGDYDNDGHLDLYVVKWGWNVLYHSNGDGTFTNVTEKSGTGDQGNGNAAVWFDYNDDGFLDLYVGNYFRTVDLWHLKDTRQMHEDFETARDGGPKVLYRNNGNGTFTNVAKELGVDDTGWTLDVGAGDYDNDGDQDLFLANDFGQDRVFRLNADATFTNVTDETIGWDTRKGMNVDLGDFNNDGWLDLYITNIWTKEYVQEGNELHRNNRDGTFTDVAVEAGVYDAGWAWAGRFWDYDNDGDLDIMVANGYISGDPKDEYFKKLATEVTKPGFNPIDARNWPMMGHCTFAGYEPKRVFRNDGNESFKEVAAEVGLADKSDGRGLAIADFDNDGDLDVFLSNQGQDSVLYRNDIGNKNNWLQVELTATHCNRSAIGARVTLVSEGLKQIREMEGGNGDHSQCPYRLSFGLGQHKKIDYLEIRWPTGYVERFDNVAPNQLVKYTENTPPAFLEERKRFKEAQLEAYKLEVEREKKKALAAANSTQPEEAIDWTKMDSFKKEYLKLRAAVSQNPKDSQTRYNFAMLLDSQGRRSAALNELEQAIRLDPDKLLYSNTYRMFIRRYGHNYFDRSIRFFEDLVDKHPDKIMPGLNKALAYVDKMPYPKLGIVTQGKLSNKSLAELDRLLKMDPNCWAAKFVRGMNHLHWPRMLGHAPLAIKDFTELIAMQKTFPPERRRDYFALAYVCLGESYVKNLGNGQEENLAKAREAWEAGLKEYPNSADLKKRLELMQKSTDTIIQFVQSLRGLEDPVDTDLNQVWVDEKIPLNQEANVSGMAEFPRRATICMVALMLSAAVAQPGCARDLDTERLLGKAYYENDDYDSAAKAFHRCIELNPKSAVNQFNLALVLVRANRPEEALRALDQAGQLDPHLLAVHYLRGILYKRQNEFAKAIDSLEVVVSGDPQCLGAFYNLGLCYKETEQYDKAIATFKEAVRLAPESPNAHNQLIILYRRVGDVDNAEHHGEIYERVKGTVDDSEKTVEALERSKYSYLIEVPPTGKELAAAESKVRFVDVTTAWGLSTPADSHPPLPAALPARIKRSEYSEAEARKRYVPSVGGSVALGDYDGDGDLDVYVVNCAADPKYAGNRLYRNEGKGRFTDVTAAAGVGDTGMGTYAIFGDYDNDQHLDLYVVNYGPNVLYHNRGNGTFEDVSAKSHTNEPQFGRKAVFVDYDHDNDLDIFVGNDVALGDPPKTDPFSLPDDFGGQVNAMLRNNGNGTFTDQTDEAGLLTDCSQTRDAVFADFDGDSDVDLLVVNYDAPSPLFLNARFGRYNPGGSFSPALKKRARAAAEGDFNRDGKPDLLVAVGPELLLYTNDGQAHFTGVPVPLPEAIAAAGVGRVGVLDHDNDGWPDLLLVDARSQDLCLLAGTGIGRFRDLSSSTGLDQVKGNFADFAAGDLDGDGDQDLVVQTRDRGPVVLRNEGGSERHWINVRPIGKKVNRCGYGSTVEIAVGGHYQKQTVRTGPVHFGLGTLDHVDVVRVTWPNGTSQNVIRPAINRNLDIEEYVKKSVSCGFLWASNGGGFKLINEILGIGPLGVPMAPGVYYQPDCTELTKIEPDQLAVDEHGMYELRLSEDLREITFADQVTLRVVDQPAGLEVIPNEMFTAPPFPEDKFFAVAEHRLPRSAVNERGEDVLDLIRQRDGRFPTFPLTRYDAIAEPHSLTLDLGDLSGAGQIMLYLDGWIDWPEASTVMAMAQDPACKIDPLSLQVRDPRGEWRTVIDSVGLPTSKGMVVPVNLTGKFLTNDWHVRLATNMCVYFDRVFVSTEDQAARCRVTELPVARADLRYRGFARMSRDDLGYERFDYTRISPTGSWDPPRGIYTRYGDVTPLLARPDDMYVIFGPGDELAMRFDAHSLPALPTGWVRSFIFYANGWVKDGDLNTKFSETVTPLPFHGMSGYPYSASEHYPDTAEHRRYQRTYNTRPSRSTVGELSRVGR